MEGDSLSLVPGPVLGREPGNEARREKALPCQTWLSDEFINVGGS